MIGFATFGVNAVHVQCAHLGTPNFRTGFCDDTHIDSQTFETTIGSQHASVLISTFSS